MLNNSNPRTDRLASLTLAEALLHADVEGILRASYTLGARNLLLTVSRSLAGADNDGEARAGFRLAVAPRSGQGGGSIVHFLTFADLQVFLRRLYQLAPERTGWVPITSRRQEHVSARGGVARYHPRYGETAAEAAARLHPSPDRLRS